MQDGSGHSIFSRMSPGEDGNDKETAAALDPSGGGAGAGHGAISPPPSPVPAPDSGTASGANASSPEALFNSGLELIKAKDYHGAAAAFARVTQLKRDWADPYYWFAVCQLNRKRYTESRAAFQRYLEIAPQGSQAASARDTLKTMPEK